jgi:hypothetical protein
MRQRLLLGAGGLPLLWVAGLAAAPVPPDRATGLRAAQVCIDRIQRGMADGEALTVLEEGGFTVKSHQVGRTLIMRGERPGGGARIIVMSGRDGLVRYKWIEGPGVMGALERIRHLLP